MRIAILGATSQIARDLILSFYRETNYDLGLFARRPTTVSQWLTSINFKSRYTIFSFEEFNNRDYFDVIINCIGIGNPAQAILMGSSIFDVTLQYDEIALNYVRQHPNCRYLFLSSGAAYGSTFDEPVSQNTKAVIAINNLQPQDWYAIAKLHAESRHRSILHLPIVDIRIFSYFSHTQDISSRFLITDILRAIDSKETLITSPNNIVRDYIGAYDFYRLVSLILAAPATNDVFDCYTKAPVDKMTLLLAMKKEFGLVYKINENLMEEVNATGLKINYFSKNHKAETLGYFPSKRSLDNILYETRLVLSGQN